MIYNVVRKVKGRTISCADVKPNEFYFCLSEYVKRAALHNVLVYCIKIARCGIKMIEANPHINEAVDLYNKLYDKLSKEYNNVRIVSPMSENIVDIYQSDDYHFSRKGQECLYQNIKLALINDLN